MVGNICTDEKDGVNRKCYTTGKDGVSEEAKNYVCIECLEPCSSLYRQYSSPNAVLLSRCQNCGQSVDPYVERELLLIIMDLLLFRTCSYRHCVFNRTDFGAIPLRYYDTKQVWSCFKLILSLSLLETYLKYEAFYQYQVLLRDTMSDQSLSSYSFKFYSSPSVPHFFLSSLLEHVFMFLGTTFSARVFLGMKLKSPNQFLFQIHNAILLPQCFKYITVFVHIWENSPTIRIMGSVFVLSFQWMAIQTIMEQQQRQKWSRKKNNEKEYSLARIFYGMPILFGIFLRIFVPILLRWTIYWNKVIGLKKRHQCASWSIHSSFFQEEICIT